MSRNDIDISEEQVALLNRLEASIRSGKRFPTEEYNEYLYLLRDLSLAAALKKRLHGNAKLLGDLEAAKRAHTMVIEHNTNSGTTDDNEKEETVKIDTTVEKWEPKQTKSEYHPSESEK